jgi:succinate dehydrogenase / fumarate reductase cytochrome b subunit
MSKVATFLTSPLGRKALMALTGLLLSAFLVAHLAANLLVFSGPGPFNEYSHKLITNPLIYVAEAGLLLLFVAHFVSGILVYLQNRAARPVGYEVKKWAGHTSEKSVASTTMIFSGIVLLVFVPLHLITFKFGAYYETTTKPVMRDLYRLVIEVFQSPAYVVFYVITMAIIGFHLWHGVGSAFQSAGLYYRKGLRRFGQIFAVAIAGGFLLIPILLFFMGGAS